MLVLTPWIVARDSTRGTLRQGCDFTAREAFGFFAFFGSVLDCCETQHSAMGEKRRSRSAGYPLCGSLSQAVGLKLRPRTV
jgi:hypothetical protein